jgi:hypothetical protein
MHSASATVIILMIFPFATEANQRALFMIGPERIQVAVDCFRGANRSCELG